MNRRFLLTTVALTILPLVGARAKCLADEVLNGIPSAMYFDLGTQVSPVESGWLAVHEKTLYDKDRGYGWRSAAGLIPIDLKKGYPLTGDFVAGKTKTGPAKHTFSVKLAAGRYVVAVASGDLGAVVHPFSIAAQGKVVAKRVGTAGSGGWDVQTFSVDVNNDTLDLAFEGDKGWLVSAIVVAPIEQFNGVRKIVERIEDQFAKGSPDLIEGMQERRPNEPKGTLKTNAERLDRGYEVFHCSYLRQIFPTTIPDESEVVRDVRLTAAPGQYEAATIGLRAFKPLRGVRVSVDELRGANGVLPADQVSVRLVRCWPQREQRWQTDDYKKAEYMVVPELLESQDRHGEIWVGANTTRQFWLTVHVPDDAKPGSYQGRVTVTAEDAPPVALTLHLEVLPFKLHQPKNMTLGMYYFPNDKIPESLVLADLQDMRQRGMTSIAFNLGARWPLPAGDKSKPDFRYLHWVMGLLEKVGGFTGPFPLHMPGDPALVRAVEAERAKNRWPEFLYYPVDEPFGGKKLDDAVVAYRSVKEAPNVRTYCTISMEAADKLGPWLDVYCYALSAAQHFAWPEARDKAVKNGGEFWWYSNATRHYFDVARFKAGFFFWKVKATGQTYWHYCGEGALQFCDFNGKERDHIAVYPGIDGPIATIQWECLREGLDDARYLWTLESLVEQCKNKESAAPALARARKVLAELEEKVNPDMVYYDKKYGRITAFHYFCDWKPEEFEHHRQQVIQAIKELVAVQ